MIATGWVDVALAAIGALQVVLLAVIAAVVRSRYRDDKDEETVVTRPLTIRTPVRVDRASESAEHDLT